MSEGVRARGRLIIVAGSSGAGKSTLMRELARLDDRFQAVRVYTTRPLRASETEKTSVSEAEFQAFVDQGDLLNVNVLHGGDKYGPSRVDIETQLHEGKFPMIDWVPDRVSQLTTIFPGQTYVVFIQPPSREILEQRLVATNRRDRIPAALEHLDRLAKGEYVYDLLVTSTNGAVTETAEEIRQELGL